MFIRIALAALFCVGAAFGAVVWLTQADTSKGRRTATAVEPSGPIAGADKAADETSKPGGVFIDNKAFEDGGAGIAVEFTGAVRDPKSLKELREAIAVRSKLGLSVFAAELERLAIGPGATKEQVTKAASSTRPPPSSRRPRS
jgi:hypothetical protein